jgi:salicylate hydroxylase
VLNLVGLASEVEKDAHPLQGFEDSTGDGEVLGFSDLPQTFKRQYGQHAMGVKRTRLNLMLKNMLLDRQIDVREGWELEDIEETDSSVTARFKGDRRETGAFLIGGDGIKAASRRILLRNQGLTEGLPPFSGLTQASPRVSLRTT